MKSNTTARTHILVCLLCTLMIAFAIHPPHCEACDRIEAVQASQHTSVHRHLPAAQDDCNGLCSCCGLLAVFMPSNALQAVNVAQAKAQSRPLHPVITRPSSVFRPPRTAISS